MPHTKKHASITIGHTTVDGVKPSDQYEASTQKHRHQVALTITHQTFDETISHTTDSTGKQTTEYHYSNEQLINRTTLHIGGHDIKGMHRNTIALYTEPTPPEALQGALTHAKTMTVIESPKAAHILRHTIKKAIRNNDFSDRELAVMAEINQTVVDCATDKEKHGHLNHDDIQKIRHAAHQKLPRHYKMQH